MKTTTQKQCETCGRQFVARKQYRKDEEPRYEKVCSRECWVPANKKTHKTFVCKWCGKVFQGEKHNRVSQYCSNKCRGLSCRKDRKGHPREKLRTELLRWTIQVILRDKACVRCGATEGLQAHHVKSWSKHPELRLDPDNGSALCAVCHHFHHPNMKLSIFLSKGGKSVKRCVYCESPYVPTKETQRTCSRRCGRMLYLERSPA